MPLSLRFKVTGTFLLLSIIFLGSGVVWQFGLRAHNATFRSMVGRAQRHDLVIGANLGTQKLFWLLEDFRRGDRSARPRSKDMANMVMEKLSVLRSYTWDSTERTNLDQAHAEFTKLKAEVIDKLSSDTLRDLGRRRRIVVDALDSLRQADTSALWSQWETMENAAVRAGWLYSIGHLVVLASAVALSFVLAGSITRPIERIVQATTSISDGNLTERVRGIKSRDELGLLCERFNFMIGELETLFTSTVNALTAAIDAKSHWTSGHSERVTNYALDTGQQMGLDERSMFTLKTSGLLHDVGKIGVPDVVLEKPGKLTDEEFEAIKQHTVQGFQIIEPVRHLKPMLSGIRNHHERYDGKGYPDGLCGEDIPFLARILAVADAFDAMTSDRPYRPGMPEEKALRILAEDDGKQWDIDVVDAFMRTRDPKLSKVSRPSDSLQLPITLRVSTVNGGE